MKKDSSIKDITNAAINRSVMDVESWQYSKISSTHEVIDFELEENELAVFEIESSKAKTIITTQRILEKNNEKLISINFDEIDDVIFGDFKKQINKPELSTFRIIDFYGCEYDFQMETGKASIGLIKAINTILKLRASR